MEFINSNPEIKDYLRCAARNYRGDNPYGYEIQSNDVKLENLSSLPTNPLEGIDKILLWLSQNIKSQDEKLAINNSVDYPQFYSRKGSELGFWLNKADELGLITKLNSGASFKYRMDLGGWKRLKELKSTEGKYSKSVFVAKSFDATLRSSFDDGIQPALTEMGFVPIYLDRDNRMGLIDNKIIAGIKESRFVIADYTLQRAGVYYEAGYASGLGMTVIDCCKKDDFHNIHFDKNHHTVLLWETPEELRTQLIDAIKANSLQL
jgi:hypothetical protein